MVEITKDISGIFKKNKNNFYIKTNVFSENIKEKIIKESKSQEEVYIFESGDSAKFLGNKEIVDKLSVNYLQIYDPDIRNIFDQIKNIFNQMMIKSEIKKDKFMYYITSEYEYSLKNDYWYDCGGDAKISLCGYYFFDVEDDSFIIFDDEKIDILKNDLIIFFSGKKISFNNINEAISFNISPLKHISGQYPQKWMPL